MQVPTSTWLFAPAYHVLLIGGLSVAAYLGWKAWRQRPTSNARYVWLGALSVLATIFLRLPVTALAKAQNLEPELWMAPFDRLIGVTVLVMLGWTLATGTRTWRIFLASGFAATALTYLSWAKTWAVEFHSQPHLTSDPTGLVRFWDAWQIVLAVAVGGALVRTSPRVPRWLLFAIGSLALGSLLELIDPGVPFATWPRVGTLLAGALFVAAAISQTLDIHPDLWFRRRSTALPAGLPTEEPEPLAALPPDDSEGAPLSPDLVATHVLLEASGLLHAAPALFCLIDPAGQVTIWGLVERGEAPRHLGRLPLSAHPTLARALAGSGLRLRSSRIARDIDQLYGLLGLSGGGPVLLQPVRAAGTGGVIIAGRPGGRWKEADHHQLSILAHRAATLLESLFQPGPDAMERVFDALENQTESVERLAEVVAGLADRIDLLEAGRVAEAASTDPAAVAAAASDDLDVRLARYEIALEALPWGIAVADADGALIFANAATARLVHRDTVEPGQDLSQYFPDADKITAAFARCRQDAAARTASIEVHFESPSLTVELEPLHDPTHGFLGVVAVLRRRTDTGQVETDVMLSLAEALKAPMTSILGYSDLLARGPGLSPDQLDRYLQRIDANLARMQVHLENLTTVLDLGAQRLELAPEAVGVAACLAEAVERAGTQLEEKGVVVTQPDGMDLPPISAHPAALDLLLDNLLAYGIQRSPQGGDLVVAAELRSEPGAGEAIVIDVADRGNPLDTETTLDLSDLAAGHAGLSVVALLAENMGGRAWAESAEGLTTISVRLPVRTETITKPDA